MKEGTYGYCQSPLQSHFIGEYTTRDEAIKACMSEHDEAQEFTTCKYGPAKVSKLIKNVQFADELIEIAQDVMFEEWGKDWLGEVTEAQEQFLENMVRFCFLRWVEMNQLTPKWVAYTEIWEHTRDKEEKFQKSKLLPMALAAVIV